MYLIQADSFVLKLFCFCFSKIWNSAMFCLLRLSITLRELWASFLLLLENFWLETSIPVGIRVLGVKTPIRAYN